MSKETLEQFKDYIMSGIGQCIEEGIERKDISKTIAEAMREYKKTP